MLSVKNLNVSIEGNQILNGLNLEVKAGEVHAIMGPNGSGKSTLSATLAGREEYQIEQGEILFKNKNLLELSPEERAGEGIFLAFQYPVEIPGVSNQFFYKLPLMQLESTVSSRHSIGLIFRILLKIKLNCLICRKIY